MKEVIYVRGRGEEETILLTDNEFLEAVICWNKKSSYFCNRIESLLPPSIKFARTPSEDLDYEVFILVNKETGGEQKVFKRDGILYQEINDGYSTRKIGAMLKQEEVERLINQEDFYTKKMYLLLN